MRRLYLIVVLACVQPASAVAMGGPSATGMLLAELFEYGYDGGHSPLTWEIGAWYGGDWNRLRLSTEGELSTDAAVSGEVQVLYSRLVAAYWELHVGLRGDLVTAGDDPAARAHLVVALDGVAPYWLEVTPELFVSQTGDISARVEVAHDLYVTQRLIAESRVEAEAAVQSAPRFGVGSGFNGFELGLRLRYELAREFAPYLGVSWEQAFAETADLRRSAGDEAAEVRAVGGARFWF